MEWAIEIYSLLHQKMVVFVGRKTKEATCQRQRAVLAQTLPIIRDTIQHRYVPEIRRIIVTVGGSGAGSSKGAKFDGKKTKWPRSQRYFGACRLNWKLKYLQGIRAIVVHKKSSSNEDPDILPCRDTKFLFCKFLER